MAIQREILRTVPLTDLVWSGNEKKTANVPVGSDFEFYPDRLPTFTEQYPKPEEFTILYRDEFSVMQPLACNYVNDGVTKYTFSYKLDNDVINLSVFKSDGHLEINVRNAKLDIPMNLNEVEFQVIYTKPGEEYPVEVYIEPEEGATVNIPATVTKDETYTWTVNVSKGYELDDLYVTDAAEIFIDSQVDGNTITFTCPKLPIEDGNEPVLILSVFLSEIPVVEYPITISETEHGTVVADKETATAGETVTLTITPEEGYELDSIEVKDSNDNVIATTETFNMPESAVTVNVTFKETPVPPTPGDGDLIFTTTFNRYAIVDVLVKEDGSAGVVNVRRLTDDDVDLDYTYETVLRAACTFRQDLIVGVEVEMNKPDNVAANYTVKSTKIFINGEEI